MADALDANNITVTTGFGALGSVLFSWKEPVSPNGIIIFYEIELVRVDVANVSAPQTTIMSKSRNLAVMKYA